MLRCAASEAPEPRSVTDDQQHERQPRQAEPEEDGHGRRGRVHLGVRQLRQLSASPSGTPARRAELLAPAPFVAGPPLEAAAALRSVGLEPPRPLGGTADASPAPGP